MSKLSMIDNITLVSTGNLVLSMTLFNNHTKRYERIPFPPCDKKQVISGFRDPKVYHDSVTFNAKVNGADFTVYVPSSINIKNTKIENISACQIPFDEKKNVWPNLPTNARGL